MFISSAKRTILRLSILPLLVACGIDVSNDEQNRNDQNVNRVVKYEGTFLSGCKTSDLRYKDVSNGAVSSTTTITFKATSNSTLSANISDAVYLSADCSGGVRLVVNRTGLNNGTVSGLGGGSENKVISNLGANLYTYVSASPSVPSADRFDFTSAKLFQTASATNTTINGVSFNGLDFLESTQKTIWALSTDGKTLTAAGSRSELDSDDYPTSLSTLEADVYTKVP